jgi:hypothetical protein
MICRLSAHADSISFHSSHQSADSVLLDVLLACTGVGCKADCFPHAVSMFKVSPVALRDIVAYFLLLFWCSAIAVSRPRTS